MACKSIITHIEAQAQRVIAQHEQLEADFAQLKTERDQLRAEVRSQQEQIRELQAEVKRLRLAEGLSGGKTDKAKSRARINLLLREVDKCIAVLTKVEQS